MKTKETNQDNWQSDVLDSDKPVLVDFYAPWCGPCKMLSPTIDKLAAEYEGKAVVLKVNTDIYPEIASNYGITALPSVVLFNKGNVVTKLSGVNPESKYKDELNKLDEVL